MPPYLEASDVAATVAEVQSAAEAAIRAGVAPVKINKQTNKSSFYFPRWMTLRKGPDSTVNQST